MNKIDISSIIHRRIKNPVKYIRWSFLFSQKVYLKEGSGYVSDIAMTKIYFCSVIYYSLYIIQDIIHLAKRNEMVQIRGTVLQDSEIPSKLLKSF